MIFDGSLAELSDVELLAALGVVAARRDQLAAEGRPGLAATLNGMACRLAEERDRRVVLGRAVDDAMAESLGVKLPPEIPPGVN